MDNKSDFYCLYDITPLKSINVSDAEFICQKDFGGHLLSVNNRYEFRFLSDYIFENHTNVVDTRIAYDLRPLGAMKFRGQTKFTDKTDANFILKRVETANTALDYQGQCYSFVRHYALRTNAIWLTKCSQLYKRFTCKTFVKESFQLLDSKDASDFARKNVPTFTSGLHFSLPFNIGIVAFFIFALSLVILFLKYRSIEKLYGFGRNNQELLLSEDDGNIYDIAFTDV